MTQTRSTSPCFLDKPVKKFKSMFIQIGFVCAPFGFRSYPVRLYAFPNIVTMNGGNCSTSIPISKTDATFMRVPEPLKTSDGNNLQKAVTR